jgi:hypothetical protein
MRRTASPFLKLITIVVFNFNLAQIRPRIGGAKTYAVAAEHVQTAQPVDEETQEGWRSRGG